jgi:cell wall-associated NlpC family hydrolase
MEREQRAAVCAEAKTWLGTKYHDKGRVKGAGCDCMTFIACVAQQVGLIGEIDIPFYSAQYGLHRDKETYLDGLLEYMREVQTPEPGDVVIWKMGRVFSHAGIVLSWPLVIHSHAERGVVIDDAERCRWLSFVGTTERPKKFLSYWGR